MTTLPSSMPLDEMLGVWGELVEAMHGVNGFGGTDAELYAYRFSPMRLDKKRGEPMTCDVDHEEAARNAETLFTAFERKYGVRVYMVGGKRSRAQRATRWQEADEGNGVPPFGHRIAVRVE